MHIGVITNPNSRKNRGRPERVRRLQSIVGRAGEVHETGDVASIKPVLREFLRRRARYWVADGGDGALHWMLRTAMEVLEEEEFAGTRHTLPLLPTKGGTIDFIANNVGISGNAESILTRLRHDLERGTKIEEVMVDSMLIEGVEVTADGDVPFRTYGFASAAGGVGQRFFTKYYQDKDPNPRTIVKVVANTLLSLPVALTPLRAIPGMPERLRKYARDVLQPTRARVTLDGMILPEVDFTGIHIASMSINLGGVFRLFTKADAPGLMHALLGSPTPLTIARNLPRMSLGKDLRGQKVIDRPCRRMMIEAVGDELLSPIIDGESYGDLRQLSFSLGPRVCIPKVVGLDTANQAA